MSALTAGIQDENWLITPAALAVQEPAPTSISAQTWIIGLSGVAILFEDGLQGMAGNNAHDWRRATVVMYPDICGGTVAGAGQVLDPDPSGGRRLPDRGGSAASALRQTMRAAVAQTRARRR